MIEQLRMTVLSENTAGRPDLLAEHGLAFWIEADGRHILFDTGQGFVLAHNAKTLGVDLGATDVLVLSHGHFDHTGGMLVARESFRQTTAYLHPLALQSKFGKRAEGAGVAVGSPISDMDTIRSHLRDVVLTEAPTQLFEGVWLTGQIPRSNDFEDTGGPFYLDKACSMPDPLLDDQAMYVQTPKGLVVFLGCAHAGVVNTVEYIAELTGAEHLHAVLGGMHLIRASEERMARTVEALARRDVKILGPAHCTGQAATLRLWQEFPGQCIACVAGTSVEFA